MTQNEYPYRNPALPLEERVEDLLGRMTLEEKVDQLMQITIGADTNPNNAGEGHSFRPTIGSVLSYSGGTKNRNAFQRQAVEHTRLGIPIIWGYDVIHGWRTGFPIPLAQACSWDPALVEAGCRVAARESYAEGVDWTFSPMLDVPHDPRWGRVMEGYGEDPLAAGVEIVACPPGKKLSKICTFENTMDRNSGISHFDAQDFQDVKKAIDFGRGLLTKHWEEDWLLNRMRTFSKNMQSIFKDAFSLLDAKKCECERCKSRVWR